MKAATVRLLCRLASVRAKKCVAIEESLAI